MIVGLTGGIGSGKSTVAQFFRGLGVPVYDSDHEAKQLMTESETVRKAIIKAFGKASYDGNKLNKIFISNIVFNDAKQLERLNDIVHPAVRKHFIAWAAAQNAPYVIQETALIFENKAQKNYDAILLVKAPKPIRIQRVMARDGVSDQEVIARMQNQLTDKEKSPMVDFIIENINLSDTKKQVNAIHERLIDMVNEKSTL